MTRLGVLVVRRFVERVQRAEHVAELRRTVELPFAPVPGLILAFADAGEMVISKIRVRVVPPGHLGLLPLEVEVVSTKEPLDGLEAALAAGWQAEARAASPAAVEPG